MYYLILRQQANVYIPVNEEPTYPHGRKLCYEGILLMGGGGGGGCGEANWFEKKGCLVRIRACQ